MIKEKRPNEKCIRICDDCGDEKEVSGYYSMRKKANHYCSSCSNKRAFELKKDSYKPWNIGKTYQKCSGSSYINQAGYKMYYIGDKTYKGGYVAEHRIVVELELGRRLKKGEVIHHIDGDKLNNNLSNLLLLNKTSHRVCHGNLEKIAFLLVQNGLISFKDNEYYIEPNVWEHISKSLELLETPIKDNQQQSPLGNTKEECSTTIQKWSTLK